MEPDHQLLRRRLVASEGAELIRLQPIHAQLSFVAAEWTVVLVTEAPRSGRLRIATDATVHEIASLPGVSFVLPTRQACALEAHPGGTLQFDLVMVSDDAIDHARRRLRSLEDRPRPAFDPRVATLVQRLWADPDLNGHVMCLLRWLDHRSRLAIAVPSHDDAMSTDTLQTIMARLEAQIDRPLDLAGLAESAGLTPAAFSRAFKSIFGLPPTRYFTRLRVELAAHRLHDPSPVSLDRIATEFGFYDQSHLNRQFKRLLGVTPGEYRRNI